MKSRQLFKQFAAVAVSAVVFTTSVLPAFATDALSPQYTYTGGGVTFEKISHPDTPVETADGIVDYIGNGSIAPYIAGESETGNGDRGQSYSYASASYGDWVYINTMYGGLGASSILTYGLGDVDAEVAKAAMDVMYNGNMYLGEPDGAYAGGILLKYNVKTGETKLLMSRETNGLIPTFRNAIKMNGKLYFVGMVIDLKSGMTPQEIATAIAMQNGFPCIYEIDPANDDKMTPIYNCVDLAGFRQLVSEGVFTSTRAIGTFGDTMIAGCLDTDGVFLCASNNPSSGQDSFSVIADMNDLFNYPAYHRTDVNGGGGIYQVIEYNNALYVVICTGTAASKDPETGTLQTFAIVKGVCNGEATDRSAWTWSVLAGAEEDGAKYPFGLDEERVSAGACSLEVYDGYLYIGDYNDVSSALQGFVLRKDFTTQATNLEQSVNLYRMDANENIEKVVGDPTEAFPDSISGLGSGYSVMDSSDEAANTILGTHMNQYTWQTTVYNGKLYVSTMDTTTLLAPIAQFTNGDLLEMSPEEWESQINYIRVLLELLFEIDATEPPAENPDEDANVPSEDNTDNASTDNSNDTAQDDADAAVAALAEDYAVLDESSAKALIMEAAQAAAVREAETSVSTFADSENDNQTLPVEPISLTEEQINELISGLLDGSITGGQISEELLDQLTAINNILTALKDLIDTTEVADFSEIYAALIEEYEKIIDSLPANVKALYDTLLSFATRDNLIGLAKSLKYMASSEAGFDLFEITNNADGSVSITPVTTDGFGDRFNHGLRIFEKTTDYWVVGTANPFYGTQLWRTANLDPEPEEPTTPTEPTEPTEPTKPTEPAKPTQPADTQKPAVTPTNTNNTSSVRTGDAASVIPTAVTVVVALGVIGIATTLLFRRKRDLK